MDAEQHVRRLLDREYRDPTSSGRWLAYDAATAVRANAVADARQSKEAIALRAELRGSLTEYLHHLAAEGLPCERALVLVKSAVRDAYPRGFDVEQASALMNDVVRWTIEAYYGPT